MYIIFFQKKATHYISWISIQKFFFYLTTARFKIPYRFPVYLHLHRKTVGNMNRAVWTSVCFCLVEAWLKNVWPGFFLPWFLWRGKTTGHPLKMQLTSRKGFIRESPEKITAFFWKLKLYRGGVGETNGRITGGGGGIVKNH